MIAQSWLTVIMIDINHVFPPINIKFGIWIYYQCPNMLLKKIVRRLWKLDIFQSWERTFMIEIYHKWRSLCFMSIIFVQEYQLYLKMHDMYVSTNMSSMFVQMSQFKIASVLDLKHSMQKFWHLYYLYLLSIKLNALLMMHSYVTKQMKPVEKM